MIQQNTRPQPYIWFMFILLALIVYTLPWMIGSGASLSFGAFDLAEWASLHPSAREMSPMLLTSFLLRLPLVCITWIMALNAPPHPFKSALWWIYGLICLVLVAFSAPPLEFLTVFRDDVNYIQQASLTLMALVGALFGLSGILKPYHPYIAISACMIGGIASFWGGISGYNLLVGFGLGVAIGIGMIASVGIFAFIAIYIIIESKRRS
jgi:hypothetical protein